MGESGNSEGIGARLRRLRQARGYTQHQLASLVGIPPKAGNVTISKWETEQQDISAQYLPRLARALSVPMEVLVNGELRTLSDEEKVRAWDQLSEAVRVLLSTCRPTPSHDGVPRHGRDEEGEQVTQHTDDEASDP